MALRLMRLLEGYAPRLIGSVLTGHVRKGSDIDLHVFSDSLEAITARLDQEYMSYEVDTMARSGHGHIAGCVSMKATKSCCCLQNVIEPEGFRGSSRRRSRMRWLFYENWGNILVRDDEGLRRLSKIGRCNNRRSMRLLYCVKRHSSVSQPRIGRCA